MLKYIQHDKTQKNMDSQPEFTLNLTKWREWQEWNDGEKRPGLFVDYFLSAAMKP